MAGKRAYKFILKFIFWAVVASILVVTVLKWVPVRYTPLMLKRSIQYKEVPTRKRWEPIEKMSPALIQAVIASEDNRFATHNGFDRIEMEKMWYEHKENGKKVRGCSTVSQQTAKNVFTFGSQTWARKVVEAYWTVLIEKIWGKKRIMEVYLNVAETGPGIYGMEAAAEHYYGKTAKELDRKQACAIVACLPAPLHRAPDKPTAYLKKRQQQILNLIPKIEYPEWAR